MVTQCVPVIIQPNVTQPFKELLPYDSFSNGLAVLRNKQDVSDLNNSQAMHRYQGNAQRALDGGILNLPKIHIHDLRAIYTAAVGEMYISPVSPPRMAMRVLGHETLLDSLAYANVRLEHVGELRGSLGRLDL